MKKLFLTLLLATLCATGYGQTIKALGYNTNGVVIGPTNALTFTNSITKQGEVEFGAGNAVLFFYDLDGTKDIFFFDGGADVARARTNLGLGATWLTNNNVTNFRTAIGLGSTNVVTFFEVYAEYIEVGFGTNTVIISDLGLGFLGVAAATTRTNLGLPLPALTNTSNVTFQGAIFPETTTNAPTNTNAPTPDAWLDIQVGTNSYKLPLWQ
jgi:hypothetical protein